MPWKVKQFFPLKLAAIGGWHDRQMRSGPTTNTEKGLTVGGFFVQLTEGTCCASELPKCRQTGTVSENVAL